MKNIKNQLIYDKFSIIINFYKLKHFQIIYNRIFEKLIQE